LAELRAKINGPASWKKEDVHTTIESKGCIRCREAAGCTQTLQRTLLVTKSMGHDSGPGRREGKREMESASGARAVAPVPLFQDVGGRSERICYTSKQKKTARKGEEKGSYILPTALRWKKSSPTALGSRAR